MKAIGKWVLIKQDETVTKSGLTISSLNIGKVISTTSEEFQTGSKVYFNKRNTFLYQ